jgi:hypothetical protein
MEMLLESLEEVALAKVPLEALAKVPLEAQAEIVVEAVPTATRPVFAFVFPLVPIPADRCTQNRIPPLLFWNDDK